VIRRRDLIGLADLERAEIEHLLQSAEHFREVLERPVPKVPTLRGLTVANMFFEPSTRTRMSFELAEKRLNADSINFSASGSSVSKGESLLDTALNIQAMKVDILVIRHGASGAAAFLSRHLDAAVLNAGDGFHEHPTQALLDMYTMREHTGRLEGLRVAIIGDIAHSRVARSNVWGLTKLGASVIVCGPSTLMPVAVGRLGCESTSSIDEAVEGADVVMALRIQHERQHHGLLPSLREYARLFCVTEERLRRASPGALVMHPGPMNRGIEIEPGVADGSHSVILDQVTNGVAVRMAALFWASGLDRATGGRAAQGDAERGASRAAEGRADGGRQGASGRDATIGSQDGDPGRATLELVPGAPQAEETAPAPAAPVTTAGHDASGAVPAGVAAIDDDRIRAGFVARARMKHQDEDTHG
jgi:aspartate carbamoyltransferase catalytic subunit